MSKFFTVFLTAIVFFMVAILAEAGMLKPGKTRPTGRSIYKNRAAAPAAARTATTPKPTAATATKPAATATTPGTTTTMNQEIPKRGY